ncbi:hypothetical protein B9Z19DRAFT_1098666 [Tuber borchii]|uniref:Myotubularin phosphatase domain-containing protein n=1 Tax=Tuber borchii TaxID=42251 RepID=A0A2T7A6L1_TUBBO|nr:hypothetical protein B9Z19DRAFT_1098666 [Tuber borchii]
MEHIRDFKVENVIILHYGQPTPVKQPREIWIIYFIVSTRFRHPFKTERDCRLGDVFESINCLSIVKGVDNLYAFSYAPGSIEKQFNGWKIYDPRKEYERMDIGTKRSTISDTTLSKAKNYLSRAGNIYPLNNCSITRCSQLLTDVCGNRSIQDEKLVAAIFASVVWSKSSQVWLQISD